MQDDLPFRGCTGHAGRQVVGDQLLHRLEPGKGIIVMCREEGEFFRGLVAFQDDRRREAAIDRQDRSFGLAGNDGDAIIMAPAFTITEGDIDLLVDSLAQGIAETIK